MNFQLMWWRPRQSVWRFVLVGITVFLLLLGTFMMTIYAVRSEEKQTRIAFRADASQLNARLETQVRLYQEIVESLRGLYDASDVVEPREFQLFAQAVLSHHPGVQALEWVPRVRPEEWDAFRQTQSTYLSHPLNFRRWNGNSEWSELSNPEERDIYPVAMVEPVLGNESALGVDLSSHPDRGETLFRARDTGEMAVTAPLALVQDQKHQSGLLMVFPVYRGATIPSTVAERRAELRGFVVGVFQMPAILRSALNATLGDRLAIRIRDQDVPDSSGMLYQELHAEVPPKFVHVVVNPVGGRTWEFKYIATPEYLEAQESRAPWLILPAGLVLSAGVGLLLTSILRRTTFAEVLVQQRTAELSFINKQLIHQSELLQRSNTDLEQFAYAVTHDLKEPLRAISANCELLQLRYQDQLDAKAKQYILRAVEGTSRMRDLIDDLLIFSRVDRKGEPPRPTDFNEVVETAVQLLDRPARESHAKIERRTLPIVPADRTQMIQLFQNLIGNAIKYRGEKSPIIQIYSIDMDTHWRIFVRDQGIGIDPEFQQRIFVVFQRLHTQEEYPGTGVGLAVCKRIVERHNGQIGVISIPGEGSTFWFTLPKQIDEPTAPPPSSVVAPTGSELLALQEKSWHRVRTDGK